MATFYDSSKEKKNEMAREQRGTYIYILFTMEQQEEKQKTDHNKILVGTCRRDRKEKLKKIFET
jgi:hypothetical protein